MHVDDFIDTNFQSSNYARWVLSYFRLSAALQLDFKPFMKEHLLFCTYKGVRYRCTGASRLGDIWLTKDFEQEFGYDLRVDVSECKHWNKAH